MTRSDKMNRGTFLTGGCAAAAAFSFLQSFTGRETADAGDTEHKKEPERNTMNQA